jgi:hypothetical protein
MKTEVGNMSTQVRIADLEGIAARTKLVRLSTGAWRATKQHKAETVAENMRHNTNAARVLVRVSDHRALSDILKLHAAAYQAHKRLTLATDQDGLRIIPAGREFQHAEEMRAFADKHNALVAEFLADYDAEKAAAPARLNGLYDASMWPPHEVVAAKFRFATQYLPTPTDGTWSDFLAASTEAAEAELRDRLTKTLTTVRDRCKSDGKLYASVFDNLRDLAALVPDLDLTGDYAPVVAAMAPLTTVHADSIRDDETARQETAKTAASILSVLGGIK